MRETPTHGLVTVAEGALMTAIAGFTMLIGPPFAVLTDFVSTL